MNRRATVTLITTLTITSAVGVIVGTSALGAGESQGPPSGTLEFDFRAGPTRGFNPARGSKPNQAPKPGDIITVRGPITQAGKRIGVADGSLTFHGGTPTFVVVFKFDAGGTLVVQGVTTKKSPTASAVVGGTGPYAGARGELVETLKNPKTQLFHETVRFIP